jgi:hypothetical protein
MAFLIFAITVVLYFAYDKVLRDKIAKDEEFPPIIRLSAVDAIDEAIGRAAETGRPIAQFPWGLRSSGHYMAGTIVGFATMQYVTRLLARIGAKTIIYPNDYGAINLARQFLLDSYAAEGKLDDLDEDYVLRWIEGEGCGSKQVRTTHDMYETVPSTIIIFGFYGCGDQHYASQGSVLGATVIGGGMAGWGSFICQALADYPLIGEENMAYLAYLQEETTQIAGVHSTDTLKYFYLSLILVGMLMVFAGNTALRDIWNL